MLGNAFLVFLAKKFTIVAEVRRFCCFVTNMLAASFRTRISKYSVSGSLISLCLVFYSIDSNNIMLGNAILVFLSKKFTIVAEVRRVCCFVANMFAGHEFQNTPCPAV